MTRIWQMFADLKIRRLYAKSGSFAFFIYRHFCEGSSNVTKKAVEIRLIGVFRVLIKA
jgi:hypothetical protein